MHVGNLRAENSSMLMRETKGLIIEETHCFHRLEAQQSKDVTCPPDGFTGLKQFLSKPQQDFFFLR